MSHRPTTLSLALDHCPHAVELMRKGTPRLDEDVFQAGIAAHAILQEVGRATWTAKKALGFERVERIADRVVKILVTKGREFEGRPEPPMHPDRAATGRAIALDYLAAKPLDPEGLDRDGFEVPLAVTDAWEVGLYDDAWLRHIADRVSVWTEPDGRKVVETRDYKSAWSTSADDLDTIQRKVAALLARAAVPDADLYRLSVVNLRTREIHSRDVAGDDADSWRDMKSDVQAAVWYVEGARRSDGSYRPIPGSRCFGCPYVLKCEAAQDWIDRAICATLYGSDAQRAELYAVIESLRGPLASTLKAPAREGPIRFEGGAVGWSVSFQRWARADAYASVADEAELCEMDTRSLLKALDLTGRNLDAFAKVAPTLDTRERREEWLAPLKEGKAQRSFGVLREKT